MTPDDLGPRLVTLARETITRALTDMAPVSPHGPGLDAKGATFVTVTRGGELHGCIGTLVPRRPLGEDVVENALAAAFEDPRACRYRAEWLPEMGVEVTLLGPLAPLDFTGEDDLLRQLVPHVDGLVLRAAGRRSTFLPQVWDNLEDPRAFLGALKMKAGLPHDFWSPEVEALRFHVQKWGDRRAPGAARPPPPPAS